MWQIPREQWVLRWPGQVVIAGSQTAWTAGVEHGIEEFRIDQFFDEMLQQVRLFTCFSYCADGDAFDLTQCYATRKAFDGISFTAR